MYLCSNLKIAMWMTAKNVFCLQARRRMGAGGHVQAAQKNARQPAESGGQAEGRGFHLRPAKVDKVQPENSATARSASPHVIHQSPNVTERSCWWWWSMVRSCDRGGETTSGASICSPTRKSTFAAGRSAQIKHLIRCMQSFCLDSTNKVMVQVLSLTHWAHAIKNGWIA